MYKDIKLPKEGTHFFSYFLMKKDKNLSSIILEIHNPNLWTFPEEIIPLNWFIYKSCKALIKTNRLRQSEKEKLHANLIYKHRCKNLKQQLQTNPSKILKK